MSATVIRTVVRNRLELLESLSVIPVCPLFLLVLRLRMVCPVVMSVDLDTEKQLPVTARMSARTTSSVIFTMVFFCMPRP